MNPNGPLIVQNDFSILLEADREGVEETRLGLARFAELVKSPQGLHTYRMTPLSLWNAAAAGLTLEEIARFLQERAQFGVPAAVQSGLRKYMKRYGLLRLEKVSGELQLVSDDTVVLKELAATPSVRDYLADWRGERAVAVAVGARGPLKRELVRLGYPVADRAGYAQGEFVDIQLRKEDGFALRDYQRQAVDAFVNGDGADGGSGVLVLPCGAGKTVVGIAAMSRFQSATLILTTNVTSVKQWKREIVDKTFLTDEQVGEYAGVRKETRPVTIATYQMLTHRSGKQELFRHMALFHEREWGLIIYDEVHLLPAPVFRATAELQTARRLGLTATLVREDGREDDVFSLVGPKRFELGWKELEARGWLAAVACREIRVPLADGCAADYREAGARRQIRLAGENAAKLAAVDALLQQHRGEPTLVIGQYIEQLTRIAERTGAPLISGEMPHERREQLYADFKAGRLRVLIVSKVANFAVDLPDASVAIQVSGSFGSRQEEAQRLGRVLRPKRGGNSAVFYSLISKGTKEQEFALKRQLFLVEQGYRYAVEDWEAYAASDESSGTGVAVRKSFWAQSEPVSGWSLVKAAGTVTAAERLAARDSAHQTGEAEGGFV
ncbi:DEAD/DEAH box helicase [Paenibacillus athensensis]|uniref:DNA 3'-5' helicase n=1 Tax=Paenibacillus athensensis TaxID=1967502 RepID=A0A4Y8PUQ1_9BACL|nr:DNA repair helicase XPB [Paenibacillus athensensis]MCD1257925.1 DEAD/DEAH box helicase [Paenibacillus athensensis]